MSDTVLTQTQLQTIFQSWTSSLLGTISVRMAWPSDGAPVPPPNVDVCYLYIRYGDDPYTRQIQTDYSELDTYNANVNQVETDVIRVSWDLYGPGAFDNIGLVRSNLFTYNTTSTLQANNLALITDVPMPIRTPELKNGQWWNRATFWANFNQLVIRQSSVPYIQSASVQTEEG